MQLLSKLLSIFPFDMWYLAVAVWWLLPFVEHFCSFIVATGGSAVLYCHLSCFASSLSCKTGLFFTPGWEGRVHYVGQQIRASCWLHIAWHRHTHMLPPNPNPLPPPQTHTQTSRIHKSRCLSAVGPSPHHYATKQASNSYSRDANVM